MIAKIVQGSSQASPRSLAALVVAMFLASSASGGLIPIITFSSPSGGEVFREGERIDINWVSGGTGSITVDAINLDTSQAYPIGTFSEGSTFKRWRIPASVATAPSASVIIRASDTTAAGISSTFFIDDQAPVVFNDPDLEFAVRNAVGVDPTEIVLPADMEGSGFVWLFTSDVDDFTGIEHAINLELLDSAFGDVPNASALEPITGLLNLKELRIQFSDIHELPDLSALQGLQVLDLSYNQLVDVNPLSSLVNLESLALGFNLLEDISAMRTMRGLQSLDLEGNLITNVGSLALLEGLDDINLSQNPLVDLTPLLQNPGLGSGDTLDVTTFPTSSRSQLSQESVCRVLPYLDDELFMFVSMNSGDICSNATIQDAFEPNDDFVNAPTVGIFGSFVLLENNKVNTFDSNDPIDFFRTPSLDAGTLLIAEARTKFIRDFGDTGFYPNMLLQTKIILDDEDAPFDLTLADDAHAAAYVPPLSPGTNREFLIQVEGEDFDSVNDYALLLVLDGTEPNNTAADVASAVPLTLGDASVQHALRGVYDQPIFPGGPSIDDTVDWLPISLAASSDILIQHTSLFGFVQTQLHSGPSSSPTPLVPDSTSSGGDLVFKNLASGDYFLKVTEAPTPVTSPPNPTYNFTTTLFEIVTRDAAGPDAFEPDNSFGLATLLPGEATSQGECDAPFQLHNFHAPGDVDWVAFDVFPPIQASVEVIELGVDADVIIDVFGENGDLLATGQGTVDLGEQFTTSRIYVRLTNAATSADPADTYYEVRACLFDPDVAENRVDLEGFIYINGTTDPVPEASIEATGPNEQTANQNPQTGFYELLNMTPSEDYVISLRAPGFEPIDVNFSSPVAERIPMDFFMTPLASHLDFTPPAALDYPETTVGASTDRDLTISNAGTQSLTGVTINIDDPVFSVVTPAAPFDIPAQGDATVTIRFTPAATRLYSGALTVSQGDGQSYALSGAGVDRNTVWADTNDTIGPFSGSAQNPFDSVPDALSFVNPGGTINILVNSQTGPITISQPVTLRVVGNDIQGAAKVRLGGN